MVPKILKKKIASSWLMLVYRDSISKVIKYASLGTVVWLKICIRSVELLIYDLVAFIYGYKNLSSSAEAVHVGPLVHEMIGRSFRGVLCNLGRRYMVCVSVPSGR